MNEDEFYQAMARNPDMQGLRLLQTGKEVFTVEEFEVLLRAVWPSATEGRSDEEASMALGAVFTKLQEFRVYACALELVLGGWMRILGLDSEGDLKFEMTAEAVEKEGAWRRANEQSAVAQAADRRNAPGVRRLPRQIGRFGGAAGGRRYRPRKSYR